MAYRARRVHLAPALRRVALNPAYTFDEVHQGRSVKIELCDGKLLLHCSARRSSVRTNAISRDPTALNRCLPYEPARVYRKQVPITINDGTPAINMSFPRLLGLHENVPLNLKKAVVRILLTQTTAAEPISFVPSATHWVTDFRLLRS